MLGIHVSEGTAKGWFGQGKSSAIVSILILIVLIAGIAFGIFFAMNARGETSVSQPNIPATPAPAPAAPKPVAPTPEPTHIIPEPTLPPAPKPVAHDYVYNVVEYIIASGGRNSDFIESTLIPRLKMVGINLTKEEVIAFQKEHGINPGDTVIIKGKVVEYAYVAVVLGGTPGYQVPAYPKERAPWFTTAKVGQTLTLRGIANKQGQLKIDDCELVK